MTVVINTKENNAKERFKRNNYWVEDLFTKFYIANRHLPHEIKAMREVVYEQIDIKVKKPVFSRAEAKDLHNSNEFDWSNYSASTENCIKEKYKHNNFWIQHLFTRFYIENQHLPHEVKAMREVIYEEVNVKVKKPVFSKQETDELHSTDEFDWSNYSG